jgi:hypothetical protein
MPFNKAQFDAGILQKLTEIANEFMEIMAKKVSSDSHVPNVINDYTGAESPKKQGNKYSIDVVINTEKGKAPMAGAYEWGSGVHGEKGKEYPIPEEATGVKFPKERWPQYQPPPPAPDIFFFGQIMHPGVKARPYIRPSIKDIREPLKKMFAQEIKRQLLMGTPKVTIIRAEK